ncbi:hypothetical protein BC831DRAFT_452210 [Entophlyctis helioformis]|nr:hypothetical protein BC831DRAFT_452210 [Entophlyctis helioformis]
MYEPLQFAVAAKLASSVADEDGESDAASDTVPDTQQDDADQTQDAAVNVEADEAFKDKLAFVASLVGRDDLALEHAVEGFVLLQLLSLISPSSIDLGWYMTDAALACPNLAMRNHDMLASGIQDTRVKQPDTVPLLSSLTSDVLERAKTGDTAACKDVLSVLCLAYCTLRGVSLPSASGSVAASRPVTTQQTDIARRVHADHSSLPATPEHAAVDSLEDQNDLDNEDDDKHIPAEPTFRPLVRWVMNKTVEVASIRVGASKSTHDAIGPCLVPLRSSLAELDDETRSDLSPTTLSILCTGRLYNLLARLLFDDAYVPTSIAPFVDAADAKREQTYPAADMHFLETLMKNGYLNFQHSLMDSMRDMISDQTPFYESIHSNVISALLSVSLRHTGIDAVVSHLADKFPGFDPSLMYPYDLEDAMLMWINQCLATAKRYYTRQPAAPSPFAATQQPDEGSSSSGASVLDLAELDDLGKDLHDGRALCMLLLVYFPTSAPTTVFWGTPLSVDQCAHNWHIIKQIACQHLGISRLPWRAFDTLAVHRHRIPPSSASSFSSATRLSSSASSSNATAMCGLYISFLVDAFDVCRRITPVGCEDKTEETAAQNVAPTTPATKTKRVSKSKAKLRDRPVSAKSDASTKPASSEVSAKDDHASAHVDETLPTESTLAVDLTKEVVEAAPSAEPSVSSVNLQESHASAPRNNAIPTAAVDQERTDAPQPHLPTRKMNAAKKPAKPAAKAVPQQQDLARAEYEAPAADGRLAARRNSLDSRDGPKPTLLSPPKSAQVLPALAQASGSFFPPIATATPAPAITSDASDPATLLVKQQPPPKKQQRKPAGHSQQQDRPLALPPLDNTKLGIHRVSSTSTPMPMPAILHDSAIHLPHIETKAGASSNEKTPTPLQSFRDSQEQHIATRPAAEVVAEQSSVDRVAHHAQESSGSTKRKSTRKAGKQQQQLKPTQKHHESGVPAQGLALPPPTTFELQIEEDDDVESNRHANPPIPVHKSAMATPVTDPHANQNRSESSNTNVGTILVQPNMRALLASDDEDDDDHSQPTHVPDPTLLDDSHRDMDSDQLEPDMDTDMATELLGQSLNASQAGGDADINETRSTLQARTPSADLFESDHGQFREDDFADKEREDEYEHDEDNDDDNWAEMAIARWEREQGIAVQHADPSQPDNKASEAAPAVPPEWSSDSEVSVDRDPPPLRPVRKQKSVAAPAKPRPLDSAKGKPRGRPPLKPLSQPTRKEQQQQQQVQQVQSPLSDPDAPLASIPKSDDGKHDSHAELPVISQSLAGSVSSPELGTSGAAEPPSRSAVFASSPAESASTVLHDGLVHNEPVPPAGPPTRQRPRTGLMTYPLPELEAVGETLQADVAVEAAVKSTAKSAVNVAASAIKPQEQRTKQQQQQQPVGKTDGDGDGLTDEQKWDRIQQAKGFAGGEGSEAAKKHEKKQAALAKLEQVQKLKAERDKARTKLKQEKESALEAQRREQAEAQLRRMEERAQKRLQAKTQERSPSSQPTDQPTSSQGKTSKSATRAPSTTPAPGLGSGPAPSAKSTPKRTLPQPKSKEQSNRNLIKNALMHVCLAGSVNTCVKEEVLEDLQESPASHFVILFRDVNNFSFRGLYSWDPVLDQTLKVHGGSVGPNVVDPASVLEYYKYDSGARTFRVVPTKSFGRSVHAVAIGRNAVDQ